MTLQAKARLGSVPLRLRPVVFVRRVVVALGRLLGFKRWHVEWFSPSSGEWLGVFSSWSEVECSRVAQRLARGNLGNVYRTARDE